MRLEQVGGGNLIDGTTVNSQRYPMHPQQMANNRQHSLRRSLPLLKVMKKLVLIGSVDWGH